MSLILSLVLLCSASLALGEVPAYCSALKDWVTKMDPEVNDYVTTFYASDAPLSRSILRSGNGITELKLETPLPLEEGKEQEFKEAGVLQYSDDGLVVRIGEKVYDIDIKSLIAWALRDQDFSLAAGKEDANQMKALAVKAVLTLLQPTITVNPENGAMQIRIAVTEKELAERMPAFLDSISADEAIVNRLLLKYSVALCSVIPNFPLSLDALKEAWKVREENPAWAMPAISLEADAAVLLASDTNKLQIGITGNLAIVDNQVSFSMEYLPDADGCFILAGNISGVFQNQAFDSDISIRKKPHQIEAKVALKEGVPMVFTLDISKYENYLNVILSEEANGRKESVTLSGYYEEEARELTGYLSYSAYDIENPEADSVYQDLLQLNATLLNQGIMGTLKITSEATIDFTLTKSGLYYRGQIAYTDYRGTVDVDAWLFPQGNKAFRYRIGIKSAGDRYLISGNASPDHFDMALAPVLGEPTMKLDLTRTREENGQSITGSLEANSNGQALSINGVVTLDAEKYPVFADGELRLTSIAGLPNTLLKLSYVPGKLTWIDNTNFYELNRSEDTAEKLAYVLIRNKTTVLGSFAASLSEADGFAAALTIGEKDVPDYKLTVVPVPYVEPVVEPATEPRILGVFEGSYDQEGNVVGTVTEPVITPVPVSVPLKIQPISTEGAEKITLNKMIVTMIDFRNAIQSFNPMMLYSLTMPTLVP